jgi:GNAT superfamily N-acetyltransferase
MSKDLNKAARCFAAFVNGRPVAFAGMLHRPHPKVDDITGCSRLVTLPDWQGVGVAFHLINTCGAAYKGIGRRLHTYPAHPALIRSFDRSPDWALVSTPEGSLKNVKNAARGSAAAQGLGGRPCAVFCYKGAAMPQTEAVQFLQGSPDV